MKALDMFVAMTGFERFSCTIANISPEFVLLPDWAKNVAFNDYKSVQTETFLEFGEGYEDEINKIMWSSSSIAGYIEAARKAMEIETVLSLRPDGFGIETRNELASTMSLLSPGLLQDAEDNPNHETYYLDFMDKHPVLVAEFDDTGKTMAISLYDMPLDLSTGHVVFNAEEKKQPAVEKAVAPTPKKEIEKPTRAEWGRYFALSEALDEKTYAINSKKKMDNALYRLEVLCEKRGLDADQLVDEYREARDEANKPTKAQWRRYFAMSEILGEETIPINSKSLMSSEIDRLNLIAKQQGLDPQNVLNQYYADKKAEREAVEEPEKPPAKEPTCALPVDARQMMLIGTYETLFLFPEEKTVEWLEEAALYAPKSDAKADGLKEAYEKALELLGETHESFINNPRYADGANIMLDFCQNNDLSMPETLDLEQDSPDACLTGEKIETPRGRFSLTSLTTEQMESAGYGFHHSSDDGKYDIMGNGTRAFAVSKEAQAAEKPRMADQLADAQIKADEINNAPKTTVQDISKEKSEGSR